MICTKCEQDKTPYNFPVKKNHPLICFDCDGDVECIYCHEKKSPFMFRIMGRVCTPCKIARNMQIPTEQMQRNETLAYSLTLKPANVRETRNLR